MSLLDQRGDVQEWAPPGWHWQVLPSGTRSLVRNPGDVVDPDLLWWQSRGPRSVHVRRYMYLLDRHYSNRWSFLQRVPYHVSYDPVRVPSLWMRSAGGSAPRCSGTCRI